MVCSVSVVGEVGERTLASTGGGLVTSPVVFSSVETSFTPASPSGNRKKDQTLFQCELSVGYSKWSLTLSFL